jgi:hypothetical protein
MADPHQAIVAAKRSPLEHRCNVPQPPDPLLATLLCTVAEIRLRSALRHGRICGLEEPGFPIPSLPAKDLRPKLKAND